MSKRDQEMTKKIFQGSGNWVAGGTGLCSGEGWEGALSYFPPSPGPSSGAVTGMGFG